MKLRHIPNFLSLARVFLALLFPFLYFGCYPRVSPSMAAFLIAGITDVLDGYLARRFGWISDAGKVIDPIADKLMQCVVIVCLFSTDTIPLWLAAFCVIKEACVLIAAAFVLKLDSKIAVSNIAGKISVCVFYAATFSFAVFGDMLSAAFRLIISLMTVFAALCAVAAYFPTFAACLKKRAEKAVDGNARA